MSGDCPPATLRIDVTHASRRLSLSFDAATATISDLRAALHARFGVPRDKQRFFFGPPVPKDRRRETRDEARLMDLLPSSLSLSLSSPSSLSLSLSSPSSLSLSSVSIPLMLIGTAAAAPSVDEAAVAQLRRLVCTTVEEGNQWFRCSFAIGYARQTAFVCRTCVDAGRADAAHAICYACAEVCHAAHDVEEWGVRQCMRCDCCTGLCWRETSGEGEKENHAEKENRTEKENEEEEGGNRAEKANDAEKENNDAEKENNDAEKENNEAEKENSTADKEKCAGRCRFVVDSATGLPPPAALIPLNRRNRRPRRFRTWCFCEDNQPSDDSACGGVVCMLCASCYWSAHLTRLHTAQFRYVPCYGDVFDGDVVAFSCRTCAKIVCAPCRMRCHREHDIGEPLVVSAGEGGGENDEHFSCGCRGSCAIAESVPRDDIAADASASTTTDTTITNTTITNTTIANEAAAMPPAVAQALMNSDAFVGVVCAHCMQECPWLASGDPRQCRGGRLPKGPEGPNEGKKINEGKKTNEAEELKGPNAEEEAKGPNAEEEAKGPNAAEELKESVALPLPIVRCGLPPDAPLSPRGAFPFHAMLLPVDAFSPAATCACEKCRAAFERFAPRAETAATAADMVVQLHNQCSHCGKSMRDEKAFMCQTCELQNEHSFLVCGTCNALRIRTQMPAPGMAAPISVAATNTAVQANSSDEGNRTFSAEREAAREDGKEVSPWDHPLTHVFLEDTYENLCELCELQVMNNLDTASREYVLENIDESSVSFEGALRQTFGETPVVFDPEDLALHQQERRKPLKRKRETDGANDENGHKNGKEDEK